MNEATATEGDRLLSAFGSATADLGAEGNSGVPRRSIDDLPSAERQLAAAIAVRKYIASLEAEVGRLRATLQSEPTGSGR